MRLSPGDPLDFPLTWGQRRQWQSEKNVSIRTCVCVREMCVCVGGGNKQQKAGVKSHNEGSVYT